MFVWGKGSFDEYKSAGIPEGKIVISGPPHLAFIEKGNRDKQIVTYFLPLLQHYGGDIQKDLTILSKYCSERGYMFVVRPHPFEKNIDIPFAVDRSDVKNALVHTGVALVQHSTTAIECLALGTPIIEFSLGGSFEQPLSKANPNIPSISDVSELHKIDDVMKTNYINAHMKTYIDNYMYMPPLLDKIVATIESYL
jgi:hypothetical protein